jgi:hypothetical protein
MCETQNDGQTQDCYSRYTPKLKLTFIIDLGPEVGYELVCPTVEPKATDFLLSCRQIYNEAASMPSILNTLSFEHLRSMESAVRKLKPSQCEQITYVQLKLISWSPKKVFPVDGMEFNHGGITISRLFRGLKEIRVCVFRFIDGEEATPDVDAIVRENLDLKVGSPEVKVIVKRMKGTWEAYEQF